MRDQKQQQHLLLLYSLSNLISTLLLNADLITPASSTFCFTPANETKLCSSSNVSISFPFFRADECHGTQSSYAISNCEPLSAQPPDWPAFTKGATKDSGLNSSVVGMYALPPSSTKTANRTGSDPSFNPHYGYINLTWSRHLLDESKNVCTSLASPQISDYIPQSILLQDFANSAFEFDPSNIILLFRCNSTAANSSPYRNSLEINSTACTTYEKMCKPPKDKGYNCYQHMIPNPSKELRLPLLMNTLGCKQAMFYVAVHPPPSILVWAPRVIRLNWSMEGVDGLASTVQACAGCLITNGLCGYDSHGNFQCLCGNNKFTSTNCSNDMTVSPNAPIAVSPSLLSTPIHPGCKILCSSSAKIGLGVGAVAGVAVAAGTVLFVLRWLLKPKAYTSSVLRAEFDASTKTPALFTSNYSPSRNLASMLTERPMEMSYSSIVSATSSFNNLLGKGGFGVVYRGSLAGIQIAVKVGAASSEHTKKHFLSEVATIGRIHHVHVVRLLGFCSEDHHQILVYEFVNNGSLHDWLFKHRGDPLRWKQRYDIAVGIAKGLGYLHEECRHRIVHCDIKPQNILLDEHFNPKIADFGLAKLIGRDASHVATFARGTPGYIAPEFWMGGESQLSTKADVYSFGMVLLELISGRQNFKNGAYFPQEAFEATMKGDIQSIIDVKLGITMLPDEEEPSMVFNTMEHIQRAIFVALWCIQDHPMSRPPMSEVLLYLEGRMVVSKQPPRPSIASFVLNLSRQEAYQSDHHHQHEVTPISGR